MVLVDVLKDRAEGEAMVAHGFVLVLPNKLILDLELWWCADADIV